MFGQTDEAGLGVMQDIISLHQPDDSGLGGRPSRTVTVNLGDDSGELIVRRTLASTNGRNGADRVGTSKRCSQRSETFVPSDINQSSASTSGSRGGQWESPGVQRCGDVDLES